MNTQHGDNILFEHPLNEKMRIFLRVEFLLNQINHNKRFDHQNAFLFFHAFSELIEIMDRSDLKTELLRGLDEQKLKLKRWENIPGVDQTTLNKTIQAIDDFTQQLHKTPKQALEFKQSTLLTSIRKRLTIPGGCCNFDILNFHLWMALPISMKEPKVNDWLKPIDLLNEALSLMLRCVRESGEFKKNTITNNYYQHSEEPISLLRIRLPLNYKLYPQVSGNANRYTIRFLSLNKNENDLKDREVTFELAIC